MYERRRYFGKRLKHETPFMEMGMGKNQRGAFKRSEIALVGEQEVYVDNAIGILSVHALVRSPHFLLYFLRDGKNFPRRKPSVYTDGGIKECIGRIEAPRFRFVVVRKRHNLPHALCDELQSAGKVVRFVSKVCSEREIKHILNGRVSPR